MSENDLTTHPNLAEPRRYYKVCVYRPCSKEFTSHARNTRFCGDTCQEKHQAQAKRRRKDYLETREQSIISVQAHKLARLVVALEIKEGRRKNECVGYVDEGGVGHPCGKTWNEVHHIDMEVLNNRPGNLDCKCKDCHAKTHSALVRIEAVKSSLKDEGKAQVLLAAT